MRCKLTAVIVVLAVLVFPLLAQADSFYVCSSYMDEFGAFQSHLYIVNPATSDTTLVGEIQYNGDPLRLTDIAYSPSTNTLYGCLFHYLFSLTLPAAPGGVVTASLIDTSTCYSQGLCVSPSGELYAGTLASAPSTTGSLYTLDAATGVATLEGSFGYPGGELIGIYGDLAFGPDGTLYGSMQWYMSPSNICAIIVQEGWGTGTALTAPEGFGADYGIDGLVFLDDTLYGVGTGYYYNENEKGPAKLYTIDLDTGEATYLFDLPGVYVATGAAPTPLPGSVLLLGSGLAGLGWWRFRGRRGRG